MLTNPLGRQVLDLKGTPRVEQNNLLDTFLTITSTSTREELESTSFLSSLDMDPSPAGHTSISPTGSRGSLGSARGDTPGPSFASLGLTGGMSSPPLGDGSGKSDGKREASRISEFRRLVSFAVRRDALHAS